MKVALIADFDTFGGTKTYFKMLVGILQRHGIDIKAYVILPDGDEDFFIYAKKHSLQWNKLNTRKPIYSRQVLAQLWELPTILSCLLRDRPDIIIVSTGTPGEWLTPFLFTTPVLHILHTVVYPFGRLSRWVLPLLLSRINKQRQIVTVSNYAAEQIKKHWGKDSFFIHNPTRFPDALNKRKQTINKHILTSGHVVDYKNPLVWLSVARKVLLQHPDARFTWVGNGPLLESLRLLASDESRILFPGATEHIQNVYADNTIYFQPSVMESHGLSVLEAMSFGLPCVTSTAGGLPESVAHEYTGYTEEINNVDAFVKRICQLLDNPSLVRTMGTAAQERVRAYFMPDQWEESLLKILKSLAPIRS